MTFSKQNLNKIYDYLWEIPKTYRRDMRVPARVYAEERMLDDIVRDASLEQLTNVATLPGIIGHSLAMPDVHEGYGFPVGGIAAFDVEGGIISPGGIGYDINCGVRLLRSALRESEVRPYAEKLGKALYHNIPSGTGKSGIMALTNHDLDLVLKKGARFLIEKGYGTKEDRGRIESEGMLDHADPDHVSGKAKDRGRDQLGTMGGGNHFVEAGVVKEIFDEKEATRLGMFKNQTTVLIHTGSRGLGHQVATDYIRKMIGSLSAYRITLPDRELACAPFSSPEGKEYFAAMSAAANFAWANRQLITWEVRRAWEEVLGGHAGTTLEIIYDVAHNIAKIEEYTIDGKKIKTVVHRKGATRAFPGQPVLIPGSMGTASYVLVGQEQSLRDSFGSSCHGAGRRMSRTKAKRHIRGQDLKKQLEQQGITIHAGSLSGLAEEAPAAYKDVTQVVDIVDRAGIAKKVAMLAPMIVVKG